MAGIHRDIDQSQHKDGDRVRESKENQKENTGMPSVDRIDLLKSRAPNSSDSASAVLPSLTLVSKAEGAVVAGTTQNETRVKAANGEKPAVERTAYSDRPIQTAYRSVDTPAQKFELNHLEHRSGDHAAPDAVVRLPQNFDPSKPIHLVIYNHGFGSTAHSSYSINRLDQHMADAPPNTVLIIPEWQSSPASRSGQQGRLAQNGQYRGMLQEVFDKTPGLKGKTLQDVDAISIFGHSAGYAPTLAQLYNNQLGDKVKSVTLLDAMYCNSNSFDPWIKANIKDLAAGKKQFNNFYFDTKGKSEAQAQSVRNMLRSAGEPDADMVIDRGSPGAVMDAGQIASHGIVFKYSNASDGVNGGAHLSMPNLYVGQVEKAAEIKAGAGQKPEQPPQPGENPKTKPPVPEPLPEKNGQPEQPGTEQLQVISSCKKILESPQASVRDKMAACCTLLKNLTRDKEGRAHITLNDGGKERDFEISECPHGTDVRSVQMFARDDENQKHPVLRFVERNNTFEQQRDANGGKVSYAGKWWSEHEATSTVGKASDGKSNPSPPQPQPEADKLPQPLPEANKLPQPHNESGNNNRVPDGTRVVRTSMDLKNFYRAQDDGVSCSAYSMAMLFSDQALGRPVSYGRESQSFKQLAGTIGHGYRGDLQSIANHLEKLGLEAKAYQYSRFDKDHVADLNAELDKGHTAVARVINPHTGNHHYIYVAGRDANGNYIIGDPDRANRDHFNPVAPARLVKMMSGRDGFVAGWAPPKVAALGA